MQVQTQKVLIRLENDFWRCSATFVVTAALMYVEVDWYSVLIHWPASSLGL
jgi:hypothetical protein